jgi:hemerythrin-like domain-containing protein
MSKGLEELYSDHANMRVLLELLESEIARYGNGEVPDFELLRSMLEDLIVFQNLVHHAKEDLVFDRLIERDPAGAETILDLLTDHALLGIVSRRFAAALSDVANNVELPREWFDQLLSEYLTAVRLHMEIEEKEFLVRAANHLTDADWLEIDAMIGKIKGVRISATIADAQLWLKDRTKAISEPK